MEIFFHILALMFIAVVMSMCFNMLKSIGIIEASVEILLKNQTKMDAEIAEDLDGVAKALIGLSEKMDSIPDTVQNDINRSSLALRELLEVTKPIKPNNWDSVKEAFKGPVRIDERN